MDSVLAEAGVVAFGEVNVVADYETGITDVTQANGIAGLQSNTVMLGWSEKRHRLEAMLRVMRAISHAGKSTVVARIDWSHEPGTSKRIDIWWGGLQNNGDLMLLLAYLLCLNPAWHDARIILRSVVDCAEDKERMSESLSELAAGFHTTIFVRNAGQFAGRLISST